MATGTTLDFVKLPAAQNITVAMGPANAIANIATPTAAELNAMQPASQSISWNDFDFGMQASEQTSDPSLADVSNFQEFGAVTYGGGISFYYPKDYDDPSNPHSLLYDLTDKPWELVMIAIRIDGAKPTTQPFADGDRVSIYLAMTDGETNSLTGAEAMRRTVTFLQQSVFAFETVVGPHTVAPTPTSITGVAGDVGRITAKVGGREYTGALRFRSADPSIVQVEPGGFYKLLKTGTTTISVMDEAAGTSAEVSVTV